MASKEGSHIVLIKFSECPIDQVTVFKDQAQVSRKIEIPVKQGLQEVAINYIDRNCVISKESIRVDINGSATLRDVRYQNQKHHDFDMEKLNEQIEEAVEKKDIEKKKANQGLDSYDRRDIVRERILPLLNEFYDSFSKSVNKPKSEATSINVSDAESFVKGVDVILQGYTDASVKLVKDLIAYGSMEDDKILFAKFHEQKEIKDTLESQKELALKSREIFMVLDCPTDETVELTFSYLTTNCFWVPSYNFYLNTAEQEDEESFNSRLCTYTTTKDYSKDQHWYHCITCNMVDNNGLCVVCAQVCHKGHQLTYAGFSSFFCDCGAKQDGSCKAFVKRPSESDEAGTNQVIHYSPARQMEFSYNAIVASSWEDWNNVKITLSTADPILGTNLPDTQFKQYRNKNSVEIIKPYVEEPGYYSSDPIKESYQISDSTTKVTVECSQRVTIPSGSQPHKIAVGTGKLDVGCVYKTVPGTSPHALCYAFIVNTSPFTLLAGEANFFLNNSFISAGALNQTLFQGEEFERWFGVDPKVEVIYKPIVKVSSEEEEDSTTDVFEHTIEVKNNHNVPILVWVNDALPQGSNTDDVEVELISGKETTEGSEKGDKDEEEGTGESEKDEEKDADKEKEEKCDDKKSEECDHSVPKLEDDERTVVWKLKMLGLETKQAKLKYSVKHPSNVDVALTDM